jgi:hypothetical protein
MSASSTRHPWMADAQSGHLDRTVAAHAADQQLAGSGERRIAVKPDRGPAQAYTAGGGPCPIGRLALAAGHSVRAQGRRGVRQNCRLF